MDSLELRYLSIIYHRFISTLITDGYTPTHIVIGERGREGWSEKGSLLYCCLPAVTVIRIYLLFHCWIVPWPGLPFPFHQEISIAIRVFRGFSTTTAIQLTPPRVTTDTGDD